jgi:hypothetical protein
VTRAQTAAHSKTSGIEAPRSFALLSLTRGTSIDLLMDCVNTLDSSNNFGRVSTGEEARIGMLKSCACTFGGMIA